MIRRACILVSASALLCACATVPNAGPRLGMAHAAAVQPASPMSVSSNPHCIRATGTLIKPPKGQCVGVPGSSYSAEELRATGAISTAAALRMLDPAVH